MYQGYDNLSAPEAIGVAPFLGPHDKVGTFYLLVSEYKSWLIKSETGREELLCAMDQECILRWMAPLIEETDDSILAMIASFIGDDLDEEAEKLAHKWARENIDEAYANRITPEHEMPWETLVW